MIAIRTASLYLLLKIFWLDSWRNVKPNVPCDVNVRRSDSVISSLVRRRLLEFHRSEADCGVRGMYKVKVEGEGHIKKAAAAVP